jgi:hypothetical protein
MILPIVFTRLDETPPRVAASASMVNSWIRSMTSWSNTLFALTITPSVVAKPVSSSRNVDVGDDLAALVDPLDRIGLDLGPSLGGDAADEQADESTTSTSPSLGRQRPELDDDLLDEGLAALLGGVVLADAEGGRGDDDADDDEHGDADGEQDAEVADHRHLREAQRHERGDAGEHGGDERRAEVGERLADRVLVVVEDDLLLDPVVDLDREVDADADQDRQAGDGDERQVDPDQPIREKPTGCRRSPPRAAGAASAR